MRRKDRQVTAEEEIRSIIQKCRVCRIGLHDPEGLYVVPLNFGYEFEGGRLTLYFHSAGEGRKLRTIAAGAEVCFEMDHELGLIEGKEACGYGYSFESIIGNGTAGLIEEPEQKKKALTALMRHQTGKDFDFTEQMANTCTVFQVQASSYTCKRHLGPQAPKQRG